MENTVSTIWNDEKELCKDLKIPLYTNNSFIYK